jgi:hypothetical protein
LRGTYDAALMAACTLAVDTQNGPVTIRPAEWLADGHVTCSIQCLNGRCDRRADVRLDTLPQDQPWARVGLRMVCSACSAADLCISSRIGMAVAGKSGQAWA